MLSCYIDTPVKNPIPIIAIVADDFDNWLESQTSTIRNWVHSIGLLPEAGNYGLFCDANGHLTTVYVIQADADDGWIFGKLARCLPDGYYQIVTELNQQQHYLSTLAWGLGSYNFNLFKNQQKHNPQLVIDSSSSQIIKMVETICWVRDMINTPTDDFGPSELADEALKLADEFAADFRQIIGDELLEAGFPAIHAVGRGSEQLPRLLDLRWGDEADPKVTLIGKGVCFDSGGLDIKPADNMILMKKDMAGAAHALGIARLVMAENLPIRLRVLIPAVENAVSGNAYHPGDVIVGRSGLSIEIGNTDAEGRVILSDALTEAASEQPELIIDLASLTGAARIAVGTEIAAFFTNNQQIAAKLLQLSSEEQDPLWQLPLYKPYRKLIESSVAHICNSPNSRYGGAISAALFLQAFVPDTINWVHFDFHGWNEKLSPGRPQGGEAQSLRAIFRYLEETFA